MARIWVVEDDESIRGMLEMMLSVEGHEVTVLAEGEAVLERLPEAEAPELVILDIMMPGTDGLTVLKAIREAGGWKHVPVVLCTALKSDEDQWKGWQSGADYYLVKPFELDHLRNVVDRLLEGAAVE